MARSTQPEMSPWKRRALTIPPASWRDWAGLAVWECWMGMLICGALGFAARLIVTAPASIVTVYDLSNCYAVPPVAPPCERIAYRAGTMNAVLNIWCGLILFVVAAWLLWELWTAVAPKPITDDFLKLLDDSFGRDWRRPRTWPWARAGYAYGFTLLGAATALGLAWMASTAIAAAAPSRAPAARVETSQHFRSLP